MLKQENGSITLFVLIAMLFFTIYLVGMYILSTNSETSQIEEMAKIKEIYEQGVNNIDDVYATVENATSDKELPIANINISQNRVELGNSLTVEVSLEDKESGIDLSKSKWIVTESKQQIGTDSSKYTGGTFTKTSENIVYTAQEYGSYYLHVLAVDNEGNSKETISNAMNYYISQTFNYTGTVQTFSVQKPGNYQIELYGASGGNSTLTVTRYGGKGGYTKGDIYLNAGTNLYFYVGGAGGPADQTDTTTYTGGWNGGGSLIAGQEAFGAPGGGATDVRLVQASTGSWYNTSHTSWATDDSLLSRIMVAGGGGGANTRYGENGTIYGYGTGGTGRRSCRWFRNN